MATYNELVKNALPDQYGKLEKLMSYTAKEQYGGVPQDWQAQIFTPLDTSNVPKALPFATPNQYLIRQQDSDGNIIREEVTTDPNAGGQLLRYGQTPAGYESVYERDSSGESDVRTGYKKSIGNVNGLPVTALYNLDGSLKGFEDSSDKRTWLSSTESVAGKWDASGMPEPKTSTRREGGLGGVLSSLGSFAGGIVGDFTKQLDDAVNETIPGGWTIPALVAAAYAGGAFDPATASATTGGTAGAAGAGTAGAAGTTSASAGGLMGGDGGITAGSSGVGLTGAGTTAYGGLGAGLGEATAAGGIGGSAIGGLGLTAGSGAAYGGLGAGLGTSAAAMGTGSLLSGTGAAAGGAATGAAGALTASELAKAGLIQGGLGLVGGLLQGNTAQNAMEADAAARAKLAAEVRDMGKFQPVGTTTRFGTSSFTTDPTTGAITPSYSLSPEALAYQNSLSALGTQGLQGGQTMMNLGQQYVGESPEAVRQRYMATQNALLAPGNEQTLAGLRTNLVNTGRQGLAYGATDAGGMGATNPELAAYYNSLATQQRQLAANAETQYQNQVNFGTGLMGSATTPFTNVFTAQKAVEAAGQQPLQMSTDFANTVATRGAAQGANYATAMAPSLTSSYNAANYNPWATALQGAASNPLVGQGLLNAWK